MGSSQIASDLAKHQNQRVELRGFEPLTPSMRTSARSVDHGCCGRSGSGRGRSESS